MKFACYAIAKRKQHPSVMSVVPRYFHSQLPNTIGATTSTVVPYQQAKQTITPRPTHNSQTKQFTQNKTKLQPFSSPQSSRRHRNIKNKLILIHHKIMSVVGEEDVVKFSVVGEHIAVFTLNRPRAMNAVNRNLSDRMEKLLQDFENDDSLWVGVLCSSHPKVFSAGADLKAINKNERIMAETGGFGGLTHLKHGQRTKPLIAAVDGLALAGGLELVLACDMLVASRTSAFALPEVKRSLVAAAGGLHRLPRRLPTNIAVEMLLTGDRLPAERAYQLGFVNHLAEPGKSYEVALELAERIVVNAPLAVRESLSMAKGLELSSDKDAWIAANNAMKRLSTTPDFKEGPKAFIEKRDPRWTGKQSKL